jgi:hypothetical protein
MLLKMLKRHPWLSTRFYRAANPVDRPFTASETSAKVDFGSGTGSKPSWAKGARGMSPLTI